MKIRQIQIISCLFALLGIAGCGKPNEFVAPPPPAVDVMSPIVKDVLVHIDFPARTEASLRVEIRARVRGFMKTMDFEAGQYVKKGQQLFTIEKEEYEAAVATANGNLSQAIAELELKKTEYTRKDNVFKKNQAVSELDVLKAEAEVKVAEAVIEINKAALSNAKRELSYTNITAPMAGRISLQEVDQGSLVGASDPTLLTNVIQDNPIYVNFDINERQLLPFLERLRSQEGKKPKATEKELRLILSDGTEYSGKGKFNFIDNAVNTNTGTVKVRAEFKNEEGSLAAGLFVRIGIPKKIEKAVLIPEMAIQRDLGGSYVLLVGDANKVERRNVKPTEFSEGDLKILEPFDEASNLGLKPDDRVVVSNLQRVRAGIEVSLSEKEKAPAKPAAKPTEKD